MEKFPFKAQLNWVVLFRVEKEHSRQDSADLQNHTGTGEWFCIKQVLEMWNSLAEVLDAQGLHRFKEAPGKYLGNQSNKNY